MFFSVGVGFGSLIAMSSYNPIHNNCRRDALFVSLCDSFTSIFTSSVVFAVLGFKVKAQNFVNGPMLTNNCQQNFVS